MAIAFTGVMPAIVGAAMQEFVDLACIVWALRAMRPGPREPLRFVADETREPDATRLTVEPV